MNVEPDVFVYVGCDESFFVFISSIVLRISSFLPGFPFITTDVKTHSSEISHFLYEKPHSSSIKVFDFPVSLSSASTETIISFISRPKQPAFVSIAPPIVPGIPNKNSIPATSFSAANFEIATHEANAPHLNEPSSNFSIREKLSF